MLRSLLLLLLTASPVGAHAAFDTHIFEGSQTEVDPESKHFVILITSFNNQKWYIKNIQSACAQRYDNFEIIFVDDCSPDKTGDLVESFLSLNPPSCKVTVIKNHQRVGALQNIYRAISWCKPNDIIVSLDGDDFLAHDQVLSKLNAVYADPDVWMTHGQLKMYPSDQICSWSQPMPAKVIKANSYRSYHNIPTHLRTFYVWLFRKIKLEDLLYEGRFYPMTWDMSFMIPMMELSGGKHAFNPDVFYIYNEQNPINDHKINKALQRKLDLHIRAKQSYRPLSHTPVPLKTVLNSQVTAFIVSEDNAQELQLFIQSLHTHVSPVEHIFVIWKSLSKGAESAYQFLMQQYPDITFIPYHALDSIREVYARSAYRNEYILLSNARLPYTRSIDLQQCIQALENTHADGFYFVHTVPENNFRHIEVDGVIKAWQYVYTPDAWKQHNPCIAILYKKSALLDFLIKNIDCNMHETLSNQKPYQVGLFLES